MNLAIINPKVYLELIRPFTLIAPMIGFFSASVIASSSLPNYHCLIGALSAALLNGASNVVNQYFDLEIDKINKPFRPYASGRISKVGILTFSCILYLTALGLSWLVNLKLFIIILITAVISFCYSAPPIRAKRFTFFSNIFIALPRGMFLIVAGWSVSQPVFRLEPWFIGLIFALFLFGAATTKDFSDIKGDSRFGIKTLPVVYGVRKTLQIISPFFYMPFILIPLGVLAGIIRPTTLPLVLLAVWGLYTARLIKQDPSSLTLEKNHASWLHMYFMLIAGQVGFAVAYLIKI